MYNQEKIKELLLELCEGVTDFTVVFTGKRLKARNGYYARETSTIYIHNKNFETNFGLMMAVIEEFTWRLRRSGWDRFCCFRNIIFTNCFW